MLSNNYFLFSLTCLGWGTSWFVIKNFQVGTPIDPMLSVSYRFLLAGVLLWIWIAGKKLIFHRKSTFKSLSINRNSEGSGGQKLSWQDHGFIFFQALTLFCFNYFLIYLASLYLTSGIIAFIFSLLTLFNLLNGSFFLRKPFENFLLIPIVLGIAGLGMLFHTELQTFDFSREKIWGLVLSLGATFVASIGNILGAYNQRRGISVMSLTSYGMIYGGSFLLALAWVLGKSFVGEVTILYIGAMLYLSIFSSIIAFYAYLTLIKNIGPERAAYNSLVFPIIAILISIGFEGYVLNWQGSSGIALVLLSNFLVFRTIKRQSNKKL